MPKTNSLEDALAEAASPEMAPPGRREPRTAPSGRTKLVGAHVPEAVHRQLRVLAAQEGSAMQDLIREALNGLFAKHKLPPIA